jgi:EpsI family protein
MLNLSGSMRFSITANLLLCAFVLMQAVSRGELIPPRQPLSELPCSFTDWTGEERPLPERIVQAVSVSDYINRVYVDPAGDPVQLYVGYYPNQKTGETIHSPKNCLPGAGWDPIRSGYATIAIPGGSQIVVNEYVIQKNLNKQMVFYWYQGRGRVIAGEYAAKFWMVADAISRNRTDGALVRIVTPVNDGEANARARLKSFAQLLFPHLEEFLPG